MKSGIYRIKNLINSNVYIGSAVNLSQRFSVHRNNLKNNKHHSIYLQRAWNKYGKENFKFEVIEYVNDVNDLIKREQYYLDLINPQYNICKIANSCLGVKHSAESSLKKSLHHARRGKFGKDSLSSKIIYQYTLNGNFIKKWYSLVDVRRKLNIDSSNIKFSIDRNGTCNGYIWSYKYLGKQIINPPKYRNRERVCKKVAQFDKDNNLLQIFNSIKEADEYIGIKNSGIRNCLSNKNKTAYGYIWKYFKEEK